MTVADLCENRIDGARDGASSPVRALNVVRLDAESKAALKELLATLKAAADDVEAFMDLRRDRDGDGDEARVWEAVCTSLAASVTIVREFYVHGARQ